MSPADLEDAVREANAATLEYYRNTVEVGKGYTTVITGAGYAGLFALWLGIGGDVDRITRLGTGAALTASLVGFVLFEMLKAYVELRSRNAFIATVSEHYHTIDFKLRMVEAEAAAIRETDAVNRLQPWFFWPTCVLGFGSALWLMVAMLVGIATSLPNRAELPPAPAPAPVAGPPVSKTTPPAAPAASR